MTDIRLHPEDLWNFCTQTIGLAAPAAADQVEAEPYLVAVLDGHRIFNHPDGTPEEWAAGRAAAEALLRKLGQ